MSSQLFGPPPRGVGSEDCSEELEEEALSGVVPAEVEGNGSPTGNSVGKPSQASKEL